jgi:bacteriorhodopsin
MSTILILGVIIFIISSIYFTVKPKQGFNSAFLVSFITLVSYIVMLQGKFATYDIYWTRWFVYGISCPLLAFEISKRVGLDLNKSIFNVFLTAIVMITGALAATSSGNYKVAFFVLSCIAFAKLIWSFYQTKADSLKTLTPYIIGWCVFPLVFIFTNEGINNLISVQNAATIYLALDIFTKIVFYVQHSKPNHISN